MRKVMLVLIVVSMFLSTGCSSQNSINKAFILNTCVFSVEEDAFPIMRKMEQIQQEASGQEEVEETYVMSLYVKADHNKNGKISKREAQKAFDRYLSEIRVVVGALPLQVPTPK